jgi:hypothetical protein
MEKKERFKRLATKRTNNVLQKLKVLGNCSNRQIYDYSEEQVDAMFSVIEKKLKEVKSKFHFPKETSFKL